MPSNERWRSAHWAVFQALDKGAMAKQLGVREELLMHLEPQSRCHQTLNDAAHQINEDLIARAVTRLKNAELSELFSKLFQKVYRRSPQAALDAQQAVEDYVSPQRSHIPLQKCSLDSWKFGH